MENFADVNWETVRPTQEEAEAKCYGVHTTKHGVRMEVRILRTVAHGAHVAWSVYSQDHLLSITGQIPLINGIATSVAFERGKQRAIKFAELWIEETF